LFFVLYIFYFFGFKIIVNTFLKTMPQYPAITPRPRVVQIKATCRTKDEYLLATSILFGIAKGNGPFYSERCSSDSFRVENRREGRCTTLSLPTRLLAAKRCCLCFRHEIQTGTTYPHWIRCEYFPRPCPTYAPQCTKNEREREREREREVCPYRYFKQAQ
jgi:hypothetical protein